MNHFRPFLRHSKVRTQLEDNAAEAQGHRAWEARRSGVGPLAGLSATAAAGGRPIARVGGRSILAGVVGLAALAAVPATATAAPPGCRLSGGIQRQYFQPVGGADSYPTNFTHRIGGRYPKTTTQAIAPPIPQGTYDLVVGTYDSHHPGNPKHVTEQWRAEFANANSVVARTPRTPDLPTSLKADSWSMGRIILSGSATSVRAVHDPSDGSNHGFVPWFVEFRCRS